MNQLFLKIVNMSISASWLVLAVLVFRLVLRKAPKWVHVLLWGIVAVRLLLPFSIESALSLIPSAETIPMNIEMEKVPAINSGIPVLNSAVNPVMGQLLSPSPGDSANPLQIWVPVLAAVWGIGAACFVVYTAASYWCLRRKVDTAVLLHDNIFQSENVRSPFVLGIIKPRIYLPFRMNAQDLEQVIAHEQAHIRRRDHWWKPLGFLLLTVYWFNPLMWLAYVLLCKDIELACDERVIKELGGQERADYTQALVSCSVDHRVVGACPLAFGEIGVKTRVKSVMNYKKPAFWAVVLAVAACVAVAVCFLTNPLSSVRNPWVQEYVPGTGNILGSVHKEKFESVSEDFAIGADQYGRAVFKDPQKAFKTLTKLYAGGIALIREEHDLPPFSRRTYDSYKRLGWQTSSGSEEEQAQALFVTEFLDIYENSFLEGKLASQTGTPATEPSPQATKWFDYIQDPAAKESGLTIELPEYPGVTFRYYTDQITASKAWGDSDLAGQTVLINDMPIWNAYFTDLTGDGCPEICATYSYGSGIVDTRFVIYDYAHGVSYEMADRGSYDFSLRLNEEDGRLYADKRVYPDGKLVSSGPLAFKDNCIQILAEETEPEKAPLDAAISTAILDHCASDSPDGLICTESHVLLAHEVMSGTPKVGDSGHMEKTTVYLLVLHQKYSVYGGKLEVLEESCVPTALTFSAGEGDSYTLEEYWEPQAGDDYARDVRAKFPGASAEDALNASAYGDNLETACYSQALAYLDAVNDLER